LSVLATHTPPFSFLLHQRAARQKVILNAQAKSGLAAAASVAARMGQLRPQGGLTVEREITFDPRLAIPLRLAQLAEPAALGLHGSPCAQTFRESVLTGVPTSRAARERARASTADAEATREARRRHGSATKSKKPQPPYAQGNEQPPSEYTGTAAYILEQAANPSLPLTDYRGLDDPTSPTRRKPTQFMKQSGRFNPDEHKANHHGRRGKEKQTKYTENQRKRNRERRKAGHHHGRRKK
jgi:hypothetical protein